LADLTKRASEIRAGIFVILALALLGAGTLWIVGRSPRGTAEIDYEVSMKGSAGVRRGDRVRVSGIEVGRVKKVELVPDAEWPVLFHISIDETVSIRRGASARITADGLLGAPYLEVLAGPLGTEPLAAGARIPGSQGGGLNDSLEQLSGVADQVGTLLEKASGAVEEIEPLMDRFHRLLSDENVEAISETLALLGPTIDHAGARLTDLTRQLETLMAHLQEGVAGLPDLSAEANELVQDLRLAVGEDGERLAKVLDSAAATLDSADGALATVGENSHELDAMLADLRAAAANLRTLSQDLKRRPALLLRSPTVPDRKPGGGGDE
jgi:phospholipid/cholesterol/gamma-HCH transport system substrate-binding protein